MEPASRTPEGEPNHCPICGKDLQIEPSRPPGDAPCPHCGALLWFGQSPPEDIERLRRASKSFQLARQVADLGRHDYAAEVLLDCVSIDPGNVRYVQAFVDALHKKFGSSTKIGPLFIFKERKARNDLKEAITRHDWEAAITNGLIVLAVNPWDVPTLRVLAMACRSLSGAGDGPASSRFAECSLFYEQCEAQARS